LVTLPAARPDVVGIVAGEPPLTVLSPLGAVYATAGQILILDTGAKSFGLLVDSVIGVRRVDPAGIRPAPAGQDERALICGTVDVDGQMMLIASADALGARL
jgi:chemotaxis signal transduction protein